MEAPVPPACIYCGQLVGDNEYDIESRGYFSSHSRCSMRDPNGDFYVTEYLDGELYSSEEPPARRFNNLKRAISEADTLARANSDRWTFLVFDINHDHPKAEYTGRRV